MNENNVNTCLFKTLIYSENQLNENTNIWFDQQNLSWLEHRI